MAAASSSAVGPSSAMRLISCSITASASAVRSARVAVPPITTAARRNQTRLSDHAVGQAALFAHFPVKPRREAAAAQNMIDDIRGHEIRIVARDALPAESDHRLRHVDIDHDAAAKPVRCRVGDRLEIVFLPAARRMHDQSARRPFWHRRRRRLKSSTRCAQIRDAHSRADRRR